jgi:hypothetical protein
VRRREEGGRIKGEKGRKKGKEHHRFIFVLFWFFFLQYWDLNLGPTVR